MSARFIIIIIFFIGSLSFIEASIGLETMKSEKRIAFVTGNAKYKFGDIEKSVTASRKMRDFLESNNFEVTYLENANKGDIVKAYRNFKNMIRRGDIALIYFSGYIISKDNKNYLLPTESRLENSNQLRERAIDLDFLISKVNTNSPRMSMVILDAYYIAGLKGVNSKLSSLAGYKFTDSYGYYTKKLGTNNSKFTNDFINIFKSKGISNIQGSIKLGKYCTHNTSEVFYFVLPKKLERDYDIAWKQVKKEDTLLAYQAFLLTYPNSPHTNSANKLLNLKQVKSKSRISNQVMNEKNSDMQKEINRLKREQSELKRLQEEMNRRKKISEAQNRKRIKQEQSELKRLKAENAKMLAAQNLSKNTKLEFKSSKVVKFIEPEMINISAGKFLMGSDASKNTFPAHKVNIKKSFKMAKNEITNGEYVLFLKATGKGYWKKRLLKELETPVVYVSWNDAVEYAKWLSLVSNKHYRLPTEAEWEYSARSSTTTVYSWGSSSSTAPLYAWMEKNAHGFVRTQGLLQANKWGIHDMFGNVEEWCLDDYSKNYKKTPIDGSANTKNGKKKVLRGGSIESSRDELKSAYRNSAILTFENEVTGFRLVLEN